MDSEENRIVTNDDISHCESCFSKSDLILLEKHGLSMFGRSGIWARSNDPFSSSPA
jgi:hypothetical protein